MARIVSRRLASAPRVVLSRVRYPWGVRGVDDGVREERQSIHEARMENVPERPEPAGDVLLHPHRIGRVKGVVLALLRAGFQPSASQLLESVEREVERLARWDLQDALGELAEDRALTTACREYCRVLGQSPDLREALAGSGAPEKEIVSTIDPRLRRTRAYRGPAEFQETVSFMARFKDYAPFNNMLVRLQSPECRYYASERDWRERFGRAPREDARPMLILAPRHPVLLVYDLEQTSGRTFPKESMAFGKFEGEWRPEWLSRLCENAETHDKIKVDFKALSSTLAGFSSIAAADHGYKMRIRIHDRLDEPSRFGVLCHELAHVYLGHLGSDPDHWWPWRRGLDHRTVEVETEATAYIVSARVGLKGTDAEYLSRHLGEGPVPEQVSLDLVAKAASRIEKMAREHLRPRRESRRRAGGVA